MARKKIYIDRSKWRTGPSEIEEVERGEHITGKGQTQLLNSQGYRCCLGFVCQQAGPRQRTRGMGDPYALKKPVEGLSIRGVTHIMHTSLTNEAIAINDDGATTPRQKERLLRSLFKDSPYQLVFEGEYTIPEVAK